LLLSSFSINVLMVEPSWERLAKLLREDCEMDAARPLAAGEEVAVEGS
jgi:hypothetical protein